MNEQAIEEKRRVGVLEGEVESPQQSVRQFKNLDALVDFVKWARPAAFNVQSGVNETNEVVWQIVYVRN